MGLKSLLDIKEKLDSKNKRKIRKISKNKQKTGQKTKSPNWPELEEINRKYEQKLILEELRKLTGLAKKLERKVAKIERKLNETKPL